VLTAVKVYPLLRKDFFLKCIVSHPSDHQCTALQLDFQLKL